MIRPAVACLFVMLAPLAAQANGLTLPGGARQLSSRISPMNSYALPVKPFADGTVPVARFDGRISRQTWRLDGGAVTTLQLLTPLREQILASGYDKVFECKDTACGGFDFRFRTEIVPAPDMYVDIRNYRYFAATRGTDRAISLLISLSRTSAYIQVIQAAPPEIAPVAIGPDPALVSAAQIRDETRVQPGLVETLLRAGHVVLGDLVFETGAAQLGDGPFGSLTLLAGYLADHPDLQIAVVGHTDSTGSLAANITLSKQRAAAVRDRLIKTHGITPSRIEAEGMGYLAPVASNLSAKGRDTNRRVEAILLAR